MTPDIRLLRDDLDAAGSRRALAPVRITLDAITDPPRERYAIGSMIPMGKSSVLYGPTSVGKSALAAQIAFAFAAGAPSLWGMPILAVEEEPEEPLVHGGPVLVYTAEDTLDDWRRKGAAIHCDGGIDAAGALARLWVVDQTEGVARLSEVVTETTGTPERTTRRVARPTDEQTALIDAARDVGARLILVETASRLVEDEDNANMSALQSALGRIARETGAAVLVTHHITKAAAREGDSSIESARGGGAFVANARNALSLFPAEADQAKRYGDRFPADDVFVLAHGKATSSSRRQAPIILIRTDATWGAVFRLPDDVAFTPEQERENADRLEVQRRREWDRLARVYAVVAKYLPTRPSMAPSWLRDQHAAEIGCPKNGPAGVEALVHLAVARGVLVVRRRSERGITIGLGVDPRSTPADRANPGESTGSPP